MEQAPPPPPRPRPALDRFLSERKIAYRQAAVPLQTTGETLRLICLPFDDPQRRVPNKELMERIWRWTAGQITPASFFPYGQEAAADTEVAA